VLLLNGAGEPQLNSQTDLNFSVAPGMKVSATCVDIFQGRDMEVSYFQIDSFAANAPEARYTSALYNGEVNFKQSCSDFDCDFCPDSLTLIAGFRMVQLNEHCAVTDPNSPLDISTCNHLYGVQLGVEAEIYNMGGPLTLKGFCKAGAFDDFATQNSSGTAVSQGSRQQAAFLGETGIVANYALTKHFGIVASYEVMWLNAVALAPEQASTASIDTKGGIFYQGGSLGVEYRF
jgi:hypothetical protein